MVFNGRLIEERYELQGLLGRSGMGEVYEAFDRHLERQVALKVMLEQLASDEAYLRRFRREAMSAASLNHPNIIHVYDFGVDGAIPYISMELVRGVSLDEELLTSGALSLPVAVEITRQVLAGLAYAHDRGVLHRDIKPGNIMLARSGQVKLTDFGIARMVDDTALTESGMVLGTYRYLAPERARGARASFSSDLYSVGCVLFEMLTGEPPFVAETPVAVALRHVDDPPPSLAVQRPEAPAELDRVVRRALAKDPQERFDDARSFSNALTGALPGDGRRLRSAGRVEEATRVHPRESRRALDPTIRQERTERRASFFRRRPGAAAALSVFVLLLVMAATVGAYALRSPGGGSDLATHGGRPTSAPSSTESAGASSSGTTDPPAATTAPTAHPPATDSPGGDSPPTSLLGEAIGEPIKVTTFGATVRLPDGWEPRGFETAPGLRTFRAVGPEGASVRVDEDLAWTGGWEDLLPDAQRLEQNLHERYRGMKTILMERTTHAGARALRWEFAYNTSEGRLHKIDLFFQRSADTPPGAVLVAWPERASKEVEEEARAVLASLAFE